MADWTGALIAFLGVMLGGAITHLSTEILARKGRAWDLTKRKHEKLEELTDLLDEYENSYRKVSGGAALKLHNGTPMEFSGVRIPTAKLDTLIQFYAPELLPKKQELDALTNAYGSVLTEVIAPSTSSANEKKELLSRVLSGHATISKKCKELSEMAAKIVGDSIREESPNN